MNKEKWTAALVQMDSREDESRNLEAAAGKVREAARLSLIHILSLTPVK